MRRAVFELGDPAALALLRSSSLAKRAAVVEPALHDPNTGAIRKEVSTWNSPNQSAQSSV